MGHKKWNRVKVHLQKQAAKNIFEFSTHLDRIQLISVFDMSLTIFLW